jgi:hypothetical protein
MWEGFEAFSMAFSDQGHAAAAAASFSAMHIDLAVHAPGTG